jgi:hypothetical protein
VETHKQRSWRHLAKIKLRKVITSRGAQECR